MQLSPVFNVPYFTDNNGNPLAGGRIYTYEAGSTSVFKNTFTSDGGPANTNPIILDAAGRLPGGVAIWLEDNQLYNLVLTEPDGVTVLKSFDNVSGVVVLSGGGALPNSVWIPTPGATYLSPTSFLVPGNETTTYALGNRARLTLSSGFTYGVVTAVSFNSGNTTVVIQNDGAALNPSLTLAEWSQLAASPAETVDAGGVSYFDSLPYNSANTVGNKIKGLESVDTSIQNQVTRNNQVWPTSGGPNFTITPSPAFTSLTPNQVITVRFGEAASGTGATLNINGLGAQPLRQYDSAGAKVGVTVTDGMQSDVLFDGTHFVILDALPPAAVITPRGAQFFTSNSTWVCPAGVTTVKVTCQGGGGGGGLGAECGIIDSNTVLVSGGKGGPGALSITYLTVTPDNSYSIAVGAGGAGATAIPATPAASGGTSSFGITLASAGGGGAGPNAVCPSGGGFGTASTSGTGLVLPGVEGNAPWGRYGSGGTPGFGPFSNGMQGSSGFVLVEW